MNDDHWSMRSLITRTDGQSALVWLEIRDGEAQIAHIAHATPVRSEDASPGQSLKADKLYDVP